MARAYTPKILTASRLIEGDVAYLSETGDWVLHHDDARLFEDEAEAHEALQSALARPDLFVGPYLADAYLQDGHAKPSHFREAFRTKGPSNYAHGKQEDLSNV